MEPFNAVRRSGPQRYNFGNILAALWGASGEIRVALAISRGFRRGNKANLGHPEASPAFTHMAVSGFGIFGSSSSSHFHPRQDIPRLEIKIKYFNGILEKKVVLPLESVMCGEIEGEEGEDQISSGRCQMSRTLLAAGEKPLFETP